MTTLAHIFFIISSSFLQVTRSTIKACMGSKFGQIKPWTVGLAALECLKKIPIVLYWEKCCDHSSAYNFKLIIFILADKKHNHKSLNESEFRQDLITY